jgi:hypothetical protein
MYVGVMMTTITITTTMGTTGRKPICRNRTSTATTYPTYIHVGRMAVVSAVSIQERRDKKGQRGGCGFKGMKKSMLSTGRHHCMFFPLTELRWWWWWWRADTRREKRVRVLGWVPPIPSLFYRAFSSPLLLDRKIGLPDQERGVDLPWDSMRRISMAEEEDHRF